MYVYMHLNTRLQRQREREKERERESDKVCTVCLAIAAHRVFRHGGLKERGRPMV
jgi:hypothetical protein